MSTPSEERRLSVLRAIVEDYVSTQEPVGSKMLVERHQLGVSPATVRNDMAALEEAGLIAQPHTSAGRIPTDKGYRLFVDRLARVKPLSAAERRAIASFLEGAYDLDDVVRRSVRLLAQLTQQVAIVQYPSLTRSTVRHIEVVGLTPTRLLCVLILSTGRVEQRVVEVPGELSEDEIADLRARVNRAAAGQPIAAAVSALSDLATQHGSIDPGAATAAASATAAPDPPAAAVLVASLVEAVTHHAAEERVVVGGAANLARFADFGTSVAPMLEALEEHVVLLKLLGETLSSRAVTVRIGSESPVQEFARTSVVATGYGPGDEAVGALGVVGPTRMDYSGSMSSVRAVARYVSEILEQGEG